MKYYTVYIFVIKQIVSLFYERHCASSCFNLLAFFSNLAERSCDVRYGTGCTNGGEIYCLGEIYKGALKHVTIQCQIFWKRLF